MKITETIYKIKIECKKCQYKGWVVKIVPEIKETDKCPNCWEEGGVQEVD